MKIGEDGSVKIPPEALTAAGLAPGDQVEVFMSDGHLRIEAMDPSGKTRGQLLVERLRGAGDFGGRTTDEIMLELRGEPADDEIERLNAERAKAG